MKRKERIVLRIHKDLWDLVQTQVAEEQIQYSSFLMREIVAVGAERLVSHERPWPDACSLFFPNHGRGQELSGSITLNVTTDIMGKLNRLVVESGYPLRYVIAALVYDWYYDSEGNLREQPGS